MHMVHSPLNPTISSASVLQITAVHAESLVWDGLYVGWSKAGWCFKKSSKIVNNFHAIFSRKINKRHRYFKTHPFVLLYFPFFIYVNG